MVTPVLIGAGPVTSECKQERESDIHFSTKLDGTPLHYCPKTLTTFPVALLTVTNTSVSERTGLRVSLKDHSPAAPASYWMVIIEHLDVVRLYRPLHFLGEEVHSFLYSDFCRYRMTFSVSAPREKTRSQEVHRPGCSSRKSWEWFHTHLQYDWDKVVMLKTKSEGAIRFGPTGTCSFSCLRGKTKSSRVPGGLLQARIVTRSWPSMTTAVRRKMSRTGRRLPGPRSVVKANPRSGKPTVRQTHGRGVPRVHPGTAAATRFNGAGAQSGGASPDLPTSLKIFGLARASRRAVAFQASGVAQSSTLLFRRIAFCGRGKGSNVVETA